MVWRGELVTILLALMLLLPRSARQILVTLTSLKRGGRRIVPQLGVTAPPTSSATWPRATHRTHRPYICNLKGSRKESTKGAEPSPP